MKKTFLYIVLAGSILAHSPLCADFFKQFKPRDAALVTASVGITGTITAAAILWYADRYHPASLAKKELDMKIQAEKRKDQIIKEKEEKKEREELQKRRAQNALTQLQHDYQAEIQLLSADYHNKKEGLLAIIKSKCNGRTPFALYLQAITNDLAQLRTLDAVLPAQQDTQRLQLMNSLKKITQAYNTLFADVQQREDEAAQLRKIKDDAEQRRIKKEELEIEKYRIDISNAKDARKNKEEKNKTLAAIERNQLNATTQIQSAIAELRNTVTRLHTELKQAVAISGSNSGITEIKKALNEYTINVVKFINMHSTKPAPTPAYNPDFVAIAVPPAVNTQPSAPAMETPTVSASTVPKGVNPLYVTIPATFG